DEFPLDATESKDSDKDGIGNNADLDDDNDGMSDEFESLYGFNAFDPADALLDSDKDGVTNGDEAQVNKNPLIDDYAPKITVPQSLHINAEHVFTTLTKTALVAATQVSASDGLDGNNCCSLTPVGFESGVQVLKSGLYPITWRAIDKAGNIAYKDQIINLYPLVNFSPNQTVAEGGNASVKIVLSGPSPRYPFKIPVAVVGNVDALDYVMEDNFVIIESGTVGYLNIKLNQDFQEEGDEQLILEFGGGLNVGAQSTHTITVSEQNIAPKLRVIVTQQNRVLSNVAKDDGDIKLTLQINDSNPDDTHIIEWTIPNEYQALISANQRVAVINPTNLTLPNTNRDILSLSVKATDSGTGALATTEFVNIAILSTQPILTNSDVDRDGLSDVQEGFVDDDLDGLPAFMDVSDVTYIQPIHVNSAITKFVETEPGLVLKLGKYARLQQSDGVMLSQQEMNATGLIKEDSLSHQNEYYDFEISDIQPVGSSVDIVLPLQANIAKYGIYRKFTNKLGWQDFVENANNHIASTVSVNDVCPAPDSPVYSAGLTEGHNCVRLTIKDGGPNDADGIENGTIDDPGGIAVKTVDEIVKNLDPETSSSGGEFTLNLALLIMLLGWRGFVARSKHIK
uniref:choice-of-anchor U domain-containing protein n=1 Tax=Paraglaciecola sp. TaxID=1920173 RepID=UPI0030F4410E